MTGNRTPTVLITLFAALAVLYPTTTALRTSGQSTRPAAAESGSRPEAAGSEPDKLGFPSARDLVGEYLSSAKASPPESAAHPPVAVNQIQFLIATAPDPASSRLPHFFDSFLESLESATEASGYVLDRFALPWRQRREAAEDSGPRWRQTLYETVPGLILFRDPAGHNLLLVFVVGETPTTGIHKDALFSALDQMAQFYAWDPKYSELPPGFPEVAPEGTQGGMSAQSPGPVPAAHSADSGQALKASATRVPGAGPASATFRIMGPSFSGSAVSLRTVLDAWSKSRAGIADVRFRIISGTATAIDAGWLSQAAEGHSTFQATVPPDEETLKAVACYIGRLGYHKIAILTEGNTAYGQNLANDFAPGKNSGELTAGGCRNGQDLPNILTLPFPMHISRLRAASMAGHQQGNSGQGAGSHESQSNPVPTEAAAEPREVLPSFSDVSVASAELRLSNLLSTIAREQFGYVGVVATDPRDTTFLAREIQEHCPATVLFTLNSDLLYAHAEVNSATRGMMVVTPYPLFNLEQLWTYAYGGGKTRLQFSNQAAEGVYNATLVLLHRDDKLIDYSRPLAGAANQALSENRKPSVWVTAIGNEEALPVALLGWTDRDQYTYTPAPPDQAQKPKGKLSVGRGIYVENSVVAVIVLTIGIAAFSLLIVRQYWRPERRGGRGILGLLGDPVSPAYTFECRLFLLCCCMCLLTFYILVAAAFCLPFMAGKALGVAIQTAATPKVAAAIAVTTIVVILVAIHALLSALRKTTSVQRVLAPEVALFALSGCAIAFVLAGFLGVTWIGIVRLNPASGLINHLRAFDLRGGLSPLVPLACVALGGCLWSLCSFRRLRLLDLLRAGGTPEKPHAWLGFLSLDVRSLNGVSELENSLKHILESSSVLSLGQYVSLITIGLLVAHYFFDTRLVRALEPRPFYWLFEAAFIIVYWALLTEFLRLVFAWRSLHQLLRRLSWHRMLSAFKRYREAQPNLTRMNLTHPPSSFAVLESSVGQAHGLIQMARRLGQSGDIEDSLRDHLRQSLPLWESQVQTAGFHLCEAFRIEWTDDSQLDTPETLETAHTKRASRIKGNWRQSLKHRCHAHQALFEFLQSLAKPMEDFWSCTHPERATTAPSTGVNEFFDRVEEFTVGRFVNFLALVFPSLQNIGYFVLAGLLLMLLAVTFYPFQPRNEFLFFNWVVILCFVGTVFWIFVQMDRDTVLSLLNDTKPGEVNFSRELVLRTLLYVAVPLMALLGAQFPASLQRILSVFTATPGAP